MEELKTPTVYFNLDTDEVDFGDIHDDDALHRRLDRRAYVAFATLIATVSPKYVPLNHVLVLSGQYVNDLMDTLPEHGRGAYAFKDVIVELRAFVSRFGIPDINRTPYVDAIEPEQDEETGKWSLVVHLSWPAYTPAAGVNETTVAHLTIVTDDLSPADLIRKTVDRFKGSSEEGVTLMTMRVHGPRETYVVPSARSRENYNYSSLVADVVELHPDADEGHITLQASAMLTSRLVDEVAMSDVEVMAVMESYEHGARHEIKPLAAVAAIRMPVPVQSEFLEKMLTSPLEAKAIAMEVLSYPEINSLIWAAKSTPGVPTKKHIEAMASRPDFMANLFYYINEMNERRRTGSVRIATDFIALTANGEDEIKPNVKPKAEPVTDREKALEAFNRSAQRSTAKQTVH